MIRNIYTTPIDQMNHTESFHNPVSMTIPDDSLSVRELFQRYAEGALERSRAQLERRLEYDTYNSSDLDFSTSEDSDIIDRYENNWDESFVDPKHSKSDPEPDPEPAPEPDPEPDPEPAPEPAD